MFMGILRTHSIERIDLMRFRFTGNHQKKAQVSKMGLRLEFFIIIVSNFLFSLRKIMKWGYQKVPM